MFEGDGTMKNELIVVVLFVLSLAIGIPINWPGLTVGKPKKSYRLKISFTPAGTGAYKGILTILSNDPHSPSVITLDAEGK